MATYNGLTMEVYPSSLPSRTPVLKESHFLLVAPVSLGYRSGVTVKGHFQYKNNIRTPRATPVEYNWMKENREPWL